MTDTIEPTDDLGVDADVATAPRRSSRVAPFAALGVAIAMIGLAVLLIGANPDQGLNDANSPLLGNPAPEATATNLRDDSPFDLSRRKGSWVVINFFRSDCVPCISEHPELIEFVDQQRALPDDGAEFYSVAVTSGKQQADIAKGFDRAKGFKEVLKLPVGADHHAHEGNFGERRGHALAILAKCP